MRIKLKSSYGNITKEFHNKEDMIRYILDPYNREYNKMNDDFDEYCRFNKLPRNIKKWNISDLVQYFFGDYDWITNKKEKNKIIKRNK